MEPSKAISDCEPFDLFRLGPYRIREGLVVKNHLLAALIKLAAILMFGLTIALYVMFAQYLLESNDLPVGLGLIAFMSVYYFVIWRGIPYYKVVFLEDYAMGPPDDNDDSTEKMSTIV